MKIKILIVDDHPCVIRGLQYYLHTQLDIELVGEATSGKEAVEKSSELQPDVVLMDLIMQDMTGIEATKQILKKHPYIKIIILTSFSDRNHVLSAIEAGANGYFMKDIRPYRLIKAIHDVYRGQLSFLPT